MPLWGMDSEVPPRPPHNRSPEVSCRNVPAVLPLSNHLPSPTVYAAAVSEPRHWDLHLKAHSGKKKIANSGTKNRKIKGKIKFYE